ncbi:MAG TPA: DUF5658 family protein [Longimicrobiales bacterium]|jgi:uncharacterized membrane protein
MRLPTARFADVVVVVFLVAQACDGVFTYVGVSLYGVGIEGNPLLAWMMTSMGEAPALAAAKMLAGAFGIALHLTAVHRILAALSAFYVAVAVLPWIAILFL